MASTHRPSSVAVQGAFKDEGPRTFPLAAEVLRQAKDWLATTEGLPQDRSGYQSAPEGHVQAGPKERAKSKRPTVQQLAARQAQMMELITTVVSRLDSLAPKASDQAFEAPAAAPLPVPTVPLQAALQRPLAASLPPVQTVPKNLAAVLGPPPPVRQPQAAASQPDKDEQAAKCIGAGELPADGPESSVLTSAVLAQSQAGPVRSSEPVVRGIHGSPPEKHFGPGLIRERLGRKGKVASRTRQRTGVFASKIRENMERRMDPTKLLPQGQVSYLRYLERHGTFAGQTLLGMIAWQVGQSLDLLQADSLDGARDVLSLLLLMLEQCAQDNGDSTLVASHAASRPAFGSFPAAGQPTGVQPSILFLSGGTEMDKCGFGLCEGAGDYIGKEGRGRPKAEASPEATGLDNSATKDRACRPAAFSKAAANGCLGREKGRRGKKVKHGWQDEPYDGTALCLPPRQVPLCSRAGDAGEVRVGPRGSSSKAATQSPATHVRARGRASPVPPHRPQRQIPLPRPQPTRGSPEDVSADVKVPAAVFPLEGSVSADGATFDFCAWVAALPRLLKQGRTQFAFFMNSTLALPRDASLAPSSALFPLPLAFPGVFSDGSCRTASHRLRKSVRRCTRFVAMGLNFLHAGGKPVPPHSLQRPLSRDQQKVYARLGGLVRACARGSIPCCSGRRGLHIAARLSEVILFLKQSGLPSGFYGGASPLPEKGPEVPQVPRLCAPTTVPC